MLHYYICKVFVSTDINDFFFKLFISYNISSERPLSCFFSIVCALQTKVHIEICLLIIISDCVIISTHIMVCLFYASLENHIRNISPRFLRSSLNSVAARIVEINGHTDRQEDKQTYIEALNMGYNF